MKVIVQQRERRMYLREDEQWTSLPSAAAEFGTVIEAIVFCIHCGKRDVRLVGQNEAGEDVYLYPFGGDPAVKAQQKNARRALKESHRLKRDLRMMKARLDILTAESPSQRLKTESHPDGLFYQSGSKGPE